MTTAKRQHLRLLPDHDRSGMALTHHAARHAIRARNHNAEALQAYQTGGCARGALTARAVAAAIARTGAV